MRGGGVIEIIGWHGPGISNTFFFLDLIVLVKCGLMDGWTDGGKWTNQSQSTPYCLGESLPVEVLGRITRIVETEQKHCFTVFFFWSKWTLNVCDEERMLFCLCFCYLQHNQNTRQECCNTRVLSITSTSRAVFISIYKSLQKQKCFICWNLFFGSMLVPKK